MKTRGSAALLRTVVILVGFTDSVAQTICTFTPRASATIRRLPELGIFGLAPVGGEIQSTYRRTTSMNRQFRRGFFEFSVPRFPSGVLGARLILEENRATTTFPMPPDKHELLYYPSDLVVNTGDYDRPAVLLTTFDTDANLPTQIFSFDVTTAYDQLACSNPGFRVKLQIDPSFNANGSFGSSFQEASGQIGPRFEVTLPAGEPPCAQNLLLVPAGTDTLLTWTVASAATGYDVVQGSIQDIRSHGGYTNVTHVCLGNDESGTSLLSSGMPAVGDALWFLVRADYSCGCGTYDSINPYPTYTYFRDTLQACACN